jgi:hypothetical protein
MKWHNGDEMKAPAKLAIRKKIHFNKTVPALVLFISALSLFGPAGAYAKKTGNPTVAFFCLVMFVVSAILFYSCRSKMKSLDSNNFSYIEGKTNGLSLEGTKIIVDKETVTGRHSVKFARKNKDVYAIRFNKSETKRPVIIKAIKE